jgi:hypothetical protein
MKDKICSIFITLMLLLSFSMVAVMPVAATIQDDIDAASSGATITLSDGTYTENLMIGKSLTITAATGQTPVIHGDHVITASDVTLDGLILRPDNIAVTIDSESAAIENTTITHCTFDLDSGTGRIGVWLGGNSPENEVSNVEMTGNTFIGPEDMISNPWRIGGWFSNPIDTEVDGVYFVSNTVDSGSIPINLYDKPIANVFISKNTFTNTDGVVYVWGEEDPEGVLSEFVFNCNDVDDTNSYGVGIDVFGVFDDDNYGDGNKVQYNNFTGIVGAYGFGAVSILSDLDTYELDARYNWWGDVSGPGGAGDGSGSPISENVQYDPWSYTPDPCTAKSKGFWKNHPKSTEEVFNLLISMSIGDYIVDGYEEAIEILKKARANNAYKMLAAQLIAALLNVEHLDRIAIDSSCFEDPIENAQNFLSTMGYEGPNTPKPDKTDKAEANGLKDALDTLNNEGCGGCSVVCEQVTTD